MLLVSVLVGLPVFVAFGGFVKVEVFVPLGSHPGPQAPLDERRTTTGLAPSALGYQGVISPNAVRNRLSSANQDVVGPYCEY